MTKVKSGKTTESVKVCMTKEIVVRPPEWVKSMFI